MGTMFKADLQNRAYVAQKAVASGFQAINFADHRTADEVRETIAMVKPMTDEIDGSTAAPAGASSPPPGRKPDGAHQASE